MNLLPITPAKTPNYYCTWQSQERTFDNCPPGGPWNVRTRNQLNEEVLFGPSGWAVTAYPSHRSDLFFLLDDGWDVPFDTSGDQQALFASCELNQQRFPSITGSPAERLRKLNDRIVSLGWRGTGLWIAASAAGDQNRDLPALEAYWRERARWCHEAGIAYWKVDWGHHAHDLAFRCMLTRVAREEAPGLVVEHAGPMGPFNDASQTHYRFYHPADAAGNAAAQRCLEYLEHSDVLRTYDVASFFTDVTTLDRVAWLLQNARMTEGCAGLLNAEDAIYLAASLGCALGVMRNSVWLESAQAPYNPYMAPYINFHKRLDEVTRALRWQRLMPAFGVNETPVAVSDQILYDHWDLKEEIAWSGITNREVVQAAPAVVARGMRLPVVSGNDMLPFVTAACHPETGAVAVATLPRCDIKHGVVLPHADVQIELEHMESPVGIFGEYHTLAITLPQSLGARSVWAQDLAGEEAVEITARFHTENNILFIPGDLISTIGRSASSAADLSYPGMLLRIME